MLASNGAKTLLIFHYSGHAFGNGGFIAMFGPHETVNLTESFAELHRKCGNVWVQMSMDACRSPEPLDGRALADFSGAASKGQYKTIAISACRPG
jgi:hypothetical protein